MQTLKKDTLTTWVSKMEWLLPHSIKKICLLPHDAVMFLSDDRETFVPPPGGHVSFLIFSQVIVLSKTFYAQWPGNFDILCLKPLRYSNPFKCFHPELPVIPKPGEFKGLFIWKKTAYETQQKANNNSHFDLTACFLKIKNLLLTQVTTWYF